MSSTDRIEKSLLIRSPKSRLWRALTVAKEFGEWFGVKLDGEFAPGVAITATLTHPDHEGVTFVLMIERVDEEDYFSYRWHPNTVDLDTDYSDEPTTLVEFRLEEAENGTMLTVVESGFEGIPAERRVEAFRRNTEGWAIQLENIQRHVAS